MSESPSNGTLVNSNGLLEQFNSSISLHPSPSSSGSVSSGYPSLSLSNSEAESSKLNNAECWELLAHIVKLVGENSDTGVPKINPLSELNSIFRGN